MLESSPLSNEIRDETQYRLNLANDIIHGKYDPYRSVHPALLTSEQISIDPEVLFLSPILDEKDASITASEREYVHKWITKQLKRKKNIPILRRRIIQNGQDKELLGVPLGTYIEIYNVPFGTEDNRWYLSHWENRDTTDRYYFWQEDMYNRLINNTEPDVPFLASRETADTLKTETSMLPPEEESEIRTFAESINKLFLDEFRQYIPEEKKEMNKDIIYRILYMNTSDFRNFAKLWLGTSDTPLKTDLGIAYHDHGKIIALNNALNYQWHYLPEERKKRYIDQYGNEKEARKVFQESYLMEVLAEEIIHQYQDESLNTAFAEVSNHFYKDRLLLEISEQRREHNQQALILTPDRSSNAQYSLLLELFRSSVHKVCFGEYVSPQLRKDILDMIF